MRVLREQLSKPEARKYLRGAAISFGCFLLACGVNFFADVVLEHWSKHRDSNEQPSGLTRSLFEINSWYQTRLSAGLFKPIPKDTVIVAITPASEPQFTGSSACMQRRLIADLVRIVGSASPKVVVLDKFFKPSLVCREQGGPIADADDKLREAVAWVSARLPVVEANFIPEDKTYVEESMPLTGALLVTGVANRHLDHRRIELGRWAYDNERDAASARKLEAKDWRPTIQFAAAQAAVPALLDVFPFLGEMVDSNTPPFTSFAGVNQQNRNEDAGRLPAYTPSWILCGRDRIGGIDDLKSCVKRGEHPDLRFLGNKVVVIGEYSDDMDWHETVLGRVQGVILVANYTESLLNRRYFWPAPWWVNGALGFLMFAGFHAVIHGPGVFWRVVGLVAMTAIAFVPIVILRGFFYYVNPMGLSLVSIAGKLLSSGGERIAERWRKRLDA
ncbi:MAG TPA: CHASE2 domain-containing protein [Bryobacteraceae bacterium]|nr:CHASE2 domain-containing protein [Bryobacteraceae bacterium]